MKIYFTLILLVLLGFVAFEYSLYKSEKTISCGGDFSYKTTCQLGTSCRSSGQGPLVGGTCQPYLTPLFERIDPLQKQPDKQPSNPSVPGADGKFCGGIAANLPQNQCPTGYTCKLDGGYPDAGGVCVSTSKPVDSNYTCPKTEWVNCMPILTLEAQKLCTQEYLNWAKSNCPGFKGAVY